MLIAYCDKCGFRVPESDLESGAANKLGENTYVCAKCAVTASPKKPGTKSHIKITPDTPSAGVPSGRRNSGAIKLPILNAEAPSPSARPGSGPIKLPASSAATTGMRVAVGHKPAQREVKSNSVMMIGGAVGAALLLVGVIVASSSRKTDVTEKKSPKETKQPIVSQPAQVSNEPKNVTPPIGAAAANPTVPSGNESTVSVLDTAARLKKVDQEMETIRNAQAVKTLSEIKTWYAANKSETLKYKAKLSTFVDKSRSTPAAEEAAKILEELKIPEDTNLVLDPGFETGKWNAWEIWGNTVMGKDVAHAKSGKHHAALVKGKIGVAQVVKGLTPRGKYVLSVWVKSNESVVWVGVKDHGMPEVKTTTRDDSYQQITMPFTMGSSKTTAMIYAFKDDNGTAHVDDFSVVLESASGAGAVGNPVATQKAAESPKNSDAPSDLQPGLWFGGFLAVDGDGMKNKFRLFKTARVFPRMFAPLTHSSPDPSMSATNFGLKVCGILRITEPGKYRFKGKGDDTLLLTINGAKVFYNENRDSEGEIALTRGDHNLKLLLTQESGRWGFTVSWKPPGVGEWLEIAESVLWHDPKQLETYKQLEKD